MKSFWLLIFIAICAMLGGGFFYARRAKAMPPLEGFYIQGYDLDFDYLLVERDTTGELKMKEPDLKWRIQRTQRGYVFLEQYAGSGWKQPQSQYLNPKTGKADQIVQLEIIPSQTVKGDWEMPSHYEIGGGESSFRELKQPIPVLHRMDDPRAREYMTKRRSMYTPPIQSVPTPETLRILAEGMLSDHPEDPYVRILYLDALLHTHDMNRLEECLAQWRPQFAAPSIPRLPFRIAEQALREDQLIKAGRNAIARAFTFEQTRFDFSERQKRYVELLNYDAYILSSYELFHQDRPFTLKIQVDAKVVGVFSVFRLLQGRRTEALDYGAAVYHLGQMMDGDNTWLLRMIGIAVKGIGSQALQMCALNGVEDAAEGQALWAMLERLNHWETVPPDAEHLIWYEPAGAILPKERWNEFNVQGYLTEYYARRGVADTRFQLARLAAAARQRLLTTGALPTKAGDLAPLLPDGPPADPFTSTPLRMRSMAGGLRCYGVGPDKTDDLGAIAYDPSNGTESRGDIAMEVPLQRKYPFPRGGVRARTREELLRQFPNDLPPDPFADTRGKPLSVSDTTPVYIYSYGPDGDENPGVKIEHPQVAYDPTNGTGSAGDLVIQIPGR